jgi:hypothetical protein
MIVDLEKFNATSKGSDQRILCQCDSCGKRSMVVKFSISRMRSGRYTNCQPCSAKIVAKAHIGRKRSEEHKRKTSLASKGRKPSALHMKILMERMRTNHPTRLADRDEAWKREMARRRLHSMLHGVLIRVGRKKQLKVHHILGYGPRELRVHLESQFQPGMNWDNQNTWHVDHIKPVSAFRAEGVDDPKVICALSNLRPLWKLDNLRKHDKSVIGS